MHAFRACILISLLSGQLAIINQQMSVENQGITAIDNWTMCYTKDSEYEKSNKKLFFGISAIMGTIFSAVCATICVKQAKMVKQK